MALIEILKEQYISDWESLIKNRQISDIFALLKRTIEFELDKIEYKGLKETILPYMEKAFDYENIGSVACMKILASDLEVLMKKIIEILEGNLDNIVPSNQGKIYLKELASHLGINQNNNIKNVAKYIRNDQLHQSIKLPYHQYYADFKDIVLSYFLAINSKYQHIYNKVFAEHVFTEYLKTVIEDYEIQQAVFVDLEVKEYIEIIGKEITPQNQLQARRDTIINLRKNTTENQMMLLGEAGMGKTTSLLYLAKKDAEEILRYKKNIPLPVYVSLASFNQETDTIKKKIAQRLERDTTLTEEYLKNGKITLFLDGFNEVLEHLKNQIIRIVQGFMVDFPKTKIVIASRPVAYDDIEFTQASITQTKKPIPAFLLLEMKEDLIKKFVENNYKGDKQALLLEINKNKNLFRILQNPLYLAEFINIYQEENIIPSSLTSVTQRFIEKKYKREKEKIDATFDKQLFTNIISEYTQEISLDDKFGMSNPQVPYKIVKEILDKIIKNTKANTTPDHFLKNAVSMNLLVKSRENTYYFAHQSYQDYFIDYEE